MQHKLHFRTNAALFCIEPAPSQPTSDEIYAAMYFGSFAAARIIKKTLEDQHHTINLYRTGDTSFTSSSCTFEELGSYQFAWNTIHVPYPWSLYRDGTWIWHLDLRRARPPQMDSSCYHGYLNKGYVIPGRMQTKSPDDWSWIC